MLDFGITREEGISCINQAWAHWIYVAEEYELYREKLGYRAYEVMFGHASYW